MAPTRSPSRRTFLKNSAAAAAASLTIVPRHVLSGKSKRLTEELRKSGYSNIRRYQLGIPFWRAAGGVCEVELDGLRHILAKDATAVVIDAREAADFRRGRCQAPVTFPGVSSSTPRIRGK